MADWQGKWFGNWFGNWFGPVAAAAPSASAYVFDRALSSTRGGATPAIRGALRVHTGIRTVSSGVAAAYVPVSARTRAETGTYAALQRRAFSASTARNQSRHTSTAVPDQTAAVSVCITGTVTAAAVRRSLSSVVTAVATSIRNGMRRAAVGSTYSRLLPTVITVARPELESVSPLSVIGSSYAGGVGGVDVNVRSGALTHIVPTSIRGLPSTPVSLGIVFSAAVPLHAGISALTELARMRSAGRSSSALLRVAPRQSGESTLYLDDEERTMGHAPGEQAIHIDDEWRVFAVDDAARSAEYDDNVR